MILIIVITIITIITVIVAIQFVDPYFAIDFSCGIAETGLNFER